MDQSCQDVIAQEFLDCVRNTAVRLNNEETNRPFHSALLSDEALFWSRFERSFSTSFGQRVIEEISKHVAISGGASEASRQKNTEVRLDSAIDRAIERHLDSLREQGLSSWQATKESISLTQLTGERTVHRVISDLWWSKDGINHYMSIKTVKPNIDQTIVAKRDLLRLAMADPSCKVYFGLYYNPYGEDRTSYAHNPPMKIFDFHNDPCVLIGREYWDTLGGAGCYEIVLQIAQEVGIETRRIIQDLR